MTGTAARIAIGVACAAGALLGPAARGGTLSGPERELFEKKIRPVLANQCYQCHAADAEGNTPGLRLDTRHGTRQVVTPKKPGQSALLAAVRGEIEPAEKHKLSGSKARAFEQWIRMGAPDPRGDEPAEAKTSEGGHWAFVPPERPEPPKVKDADWPRNVIDRFVLAKLEAEGLEPVREADRRTLIRRLYFDLIGLPPSPEAVQRFVNSDDPRAYEKLVDRLLASPRFGERWGRHWLDVARFGESSGKEFNFTYPHAWPYRDWVIEAFNNNTPYDRFIEEQIAGDLMEAAGPVQHQQQAMGTGFLAVGPKRHNASGTVFKADLVDDQIDTTGKAFLGMTLGCARCHDHKFDPVSQKEYYGLAGIFYSTQTLYGTEKIKYSDHPSGLIPFGGPNAKAKHKRHQAHLEKLENAKKQRDKAKKELEKLKKKLKKASGEAKQELKEKVAGAKKQYNKRKGAVEKIKGNAPPAPKYAFGAKEGKARDTKLRVGGNPYKKDEKVERGFIDAVSWSGAPEIDPERSGRMALAKWIASEENPLTARVFVNRVWHHLFGRGIVKTVDNFGTTGSEPTHPALLDHLATRFMADGWSMKGVIRRVVMSRTYRLSSRPHQRNHAVDPDNKLLWRMSPRRLEVEAIRDAMLAASGRLNLTPAKGSPVTDLGQELARRISESKLNPGGNRRSVYLPVVRHYAPQMHQNFDFASPDLVTGRRSVTTVPAQALFMMNDGFVMKQARHMARRLLEGPGSGARHRVERAYRLTLGRPPTSRERREAVAYVEEMKAKLEPQEKDEAERRVKAWAGFCQALFASAEFRYLIDAPAGGSSPRADRPASKEGSGASS